MTITIAVDAMGGDRGPEVTVPGALAALEHSPDFDLILVGNEDQIRAQFGTDSQPRNLKIVAASQSVGMDESPAHALRNKKDSSMRVAINLVKSGEADACVSAGNTGALMATARFVLKTLPGIDRPAIVGAMPSLRGHVHMLDLGANVDSPAHLLLQFAVMGSILVKYLENKDNPSVALLNIGVEDIKGNDTVKQAAQLMQRSGLNYKGFVEADAIYTGDVDVIVCDGFDGNVALKASEGLAQFISSTMRQEFKRNILTKIAGLIALPLMSSLRKRIDYRRYNGATLLGLHGIVVKSHGGADALAFRQAIHVAVTEVKKKVPQHISQELAGLMKATG